MKLVYLFGLGALLTVGLTDVLVVKDSALAIHQVVGD